MLLKKVLSIKLRGFQCGGRLKSVECNVIMCSEYNILKAFHLKQIAAHSLTLSDDAKISLITVLSTTDVHACL